MKTQYSENSSFFCCLCDILLYHCSHSAGKGPGLSRSCIPGFGQRAPQAARSIPSLPPRPTEEFGFSCLQSTRRRAAAHPRPSTGMSLWFGQMVPREQGCSFLCPGPAPGHCESNHSAQLPHKKSERLVVGPKQRSWR